MSNIEKVRATVNYKGPNADNSSRVARLRKIHTRTKQADGANNAEAAKLHKGDDSSHMMFKSAFVKLHRKTNQ